MTHAEQHKMILDLRECVYKMNRREQEEFEMFAKRDKDDEDLDAIAQRRLLAMFDAFVSKGRKP